MHSESILVRIPSRRDDSQKPKRLPKSAGEGGRRRKTWTQLLINHLDETPHSMVSNREVDMQKIFQVAAREIKLAMLPTSWDGLQHMPRSSVRADLPEA
jgi:hypothetical protein